MLIKQENMMGSPDGYTGNMGVCFFKSQLVLVSFSLISCNFFFTQTPLSCVCHQAQ